MNDQKQLFVYSGDEGDVTWDGRLCIHVGECGRAQGDLFVNGRKPWCDPSQASSQEAKEVVSRCPSGALVYKPKQGSTVEPAPRNTVVVSNNGPLYLTGDLEVDGAEQDQVGLSRRAALCRCGQSRNKPFCDNSHEGAKFVDRGAVGQAGDGSGAAAGPLKVQRAPNGPLLLQGPVTIVASSGRPAFSGQKVALCRCGASANKPFCDGSHVAAGFQAS